MPRNVEIKARLDSLAAIRPLIESVADQGPYELLQDDTFFTCASGRLKLRTGSAPEDAELIYYRRIDRQAPKESFYIRTRTPDPDALRTSLTLAYGEVGRVQKHRTVFLVGRTRVHLDRVRGLGDFLELEVVLDEEESPEAGAAVANALLLRLGILASQLVECAYVDPLSAGNPWQ